MLGVVLEPRCPPGERAQLTSSNPALGWERRFAPEPCSILVGLNVMSYHDRVTEFEEDGGGSRGVGSGLEHQDRHSARAWSRSEASLTWARKQICRGDECGKEQRPPQGEQTGDLFSVCCRQGLSHQHWCLAETQRQVGKPYGD